MFGNQQRSFQFVWFDQFDWYSFDKDAAFCFSCRHFAAASGNVHYFHYISGFQNWRKAQQSFNAHNVSVAHTFSMEAWCEFKQMMQGGSKILNIIDKGHSNVVEENQHCTKAVVELACQGSVWPQRVSEQGKLYQTPQCHQHV